MELVLDFLDSLDNYSNSPAAPASATAPPPAAADGSVPPVPASAPAKADPYNVEDAQSVLDFLDEITQRSSTPTPAIKRSALTSSASLSNVPGGGLSRSGSRTNILSTVAASRKSGESIRSARTTSNNSPASTPLPLPETPGVAESTAAPAASTDGGWGWGSVWNSATTIVQQARTVAEEQVKTATATASNVGGLGGLGEGLMKALGENEQAKKWGEGVREFARTNQLDQLGKDLRSQTLKSLTELLNAVAPPIAEHEVIKVNLSHDMIGYDGVETLVYRGLAKVRQCALPRPFAHIRLQIMEQIEGGTLVVNKGDEEKPKEDAAVSPDGEERKLNYVEGLAEGWKLAGVCLRLTPTAQHTDERFTGQSRPTHQELIPAVDKSGRGGGERRFDRQLDGPRHDLSDLHANPALPRSPSLLPLQYRRPFRHSRICHHVRRTDNGALLPAPSPRSHAQLGALESLAIDSSIMAGYSVRRKRVGGGCDGGRHSTRRRSDRSRM